MNKTTNIVQLNVREKNVSNLNTLIKCGIYGITTSTAVNGATKFLLEVLPADAELDTIIQRQTIIGVNGQVIYDRSYNGTTWTPWTVNEWVMVSANGQPTEPSLLKHSGVAGVLPEWEAVNPNIFFYGIRLGENQTFLTPAEAKAAVPEGVRKPGLITTYVTTTGEVDVLTFTHKADAAGTVVVVLDGVNYGVDVIAEDTAIQIAAKVYAARAAFVGWTLAYEIGTAIVTFTKNAIGPVTVPAFVDPIALAENDTLTITTAPTTDGTITVSLDGVAVDVELVALTHTTPELVAAAIASTTFTGWSAVATEDKISFINETTGICAAPVFADTDNTGAEGTFERTVEGSVITGVTATTAISAKGGINFWVMDQFRWADVEDWLDLSKWVEFDIK